MVIFYYSYFNMEKDTILIIINVIDYTCKYILSENTFLWQQYSTQIIVYIVLDKIEHVHNAECLRKYKK